ncbi:MAG: hypothetical protein CVU46_11150 [Chloroflexi bacterium HGW-Chloroflexi-8]|jgi:murein DD-endopeptidase MepM/ murein hydrolase activator NlpD|nr:MAG: hypothetical protein CVU46_11150 [Chloroflexi bacterium HGW-Chloroflexi-8]
MVTPVKGRVSSKFGYRIHPITKEKKSFHNGVDISAPEGTPIVAPVAGKITEFWTHDRGGHCLALTSADGLLRFGFAHLSKRFVSRGAVVKQGELIANVGNTGVSTGAHLHFTMKKNGSWIDPQLHFSF